MTRATMTASDEATIEALRSDVALQVMRFAKREGATQTVVAKRLGVPQPTLSKIMNGRVSDLSLELLIRVAVRAGLSITIHTGRMPEEAGAFISRKTEKPVSRLAEEARASASRTVRRLSPSEGLEAFLEHNQLVAALCVAGQRAERRRRGEPGP
jgi:predicted XRE-type DNA-binding protein